MPTIVKHVAKNGKITYKAKVRRAGYPPKCKTFPVRSDAMRWASEYERSIEAGTAAKGSAADRTTLAAIFTRYRDEVTPTKRGHVEERRRIEAFLTWPVAKVRMSDLTTAHLAAMRDWRLLQVSDGTVLREIVILRSVVTRARREWGVAIADPFAALAKPKPPEPRDRRLLAGEEARLYEAVRRSHNTFLRPAVTLAIETAMRRGELMALRWVDVDLSARVALLRTTKNGKPRRVPLSTVAVQVLAGMPRKGECVFEGWNGRALYKAFTALTKRAGITGLTFHSLRHEAISRFVERGLNLMECAAISGHSTLDMLRRYTHLRAEDIAAKLG